MRSEYDADPYVDSRGLQLGLKDAVYRTLE